LTEFVELPEDALPSSSTSASSAQSASIPQPGQPGQPAQEVKEGLWYSNVLAGVVRGALEMVSVMT
jgi:hypothetical protein